MGKTIKSIVGVVAALGQDLGLVSTPKAPKPPPPPKTPAPVVTQDTGGGGGGGGDGGGNTTTTTPAPLLDNPAKVADTGALESTTKKAAQSGGPSDTMLTGTVGVDPASLTLGKNTLLGG